MTFKHKLSVRLALLKDALVVGALAALACEMPVVPPDPDPDPTIHLQISPKSVTLPTNGTSQLTAVALNSTGDTVDLSLSWTATGGSMTDTSTSARRHYGRYKAGSDTGKFKVVVHGNGNGGTATDTATITVIQPAVASVGVTPATVTLFAGTAVQLTASTMDSTGTQLSGRAIAWSSSNGTVASVSASGMVTALTQGAATITATSEGKGASATITVMIVPVASVAVSPATASIAAGQTVQLTATPKDSAGDALTGRSVSWTSSNTSVATVNGSGLVTAVVAGSATITATSEGRSGSAAITVQAVAVAVASVTVSPATASVQAKRTLQLTATPEDSAGTVLTGRSVTWASSNTSVATVNGSGLVTTVVAGTATITATSEGKSGSAAITVIPIPVASVAVSPATASIAAGQTVQLTATPKDSAGGALTGRSVSWTSSNTSVATVGSGLVTAVVAGSATITATSEGRSGSAAITVQAVAVAVASVTVSPATASVQAKRTLQLTATPKDSAGTALTGRSVTWASSNTSVATVNGSGLVTTVVAGTATITATSEGKSGSAAITVTPIPVASVAVSPATASIAAGQTVQLTATPKDSAGGALTGRSVSWTSSNTLVAIVNGSGLVTGVVVGTATITATSEGKSGTSSVTVQVPLPLGLIPDPTLLPVGTGQAPNVAAYLALNVAGRPAGFSYNDPVTGVKVWKVTSSTTPTSNSGAGHDYGEGGNAVSRGWGPNHNTHTILMRGDGMSYYLVDFTRGVGFSNYRQLTAPPRRDICATFSSVAGTERILYVHTGSQLIRYNTQTMQTENTGNFPLSNNIYTWLHQDRNDVWFTGLLDDNQTVWAWNSQTNQYLTHNESWTNEPRMERNGRYIVLTGGSSPSTVKVWDLANNSFGPQQSMNYFSHLASLRGRWVAVDNNANAPPPLDRYQIVGGSLTRSSAVFNNSGGYETNNSGNWVQNDDALQWAYISGVDESSFSNLLAFRQGVGLVRADGSDARLLVHHYTHSPNYWDYAWGQPSPDGKVAIFNSNMYGSGRYDLFVAEVPLR